MTRVGELVVNRRRSVLAVIGVLALAAAIGIPRLEADFTVDALFADAGDLRRITREARERFGNTDNALLVVIEAGSEGWPKRLERIATLTAACEDLAGVARVTSLTNIRLNGEARLLGPLAAGGAIDEAVATERIRAALATPLVRGRLLSADERVTVVVVQLEPKVTSADELSEIVDAVDALAGRVAMDSGDRVSLGGLPFIRVEVVRAMNRDQARLLPIGFAVCLIVLFIAFRWWPALVIPLACVGLSVLICVGVMAWTGTPLDVVTNIVPLLIVIIGMSDSIHLIARHLEERSAGAPPPRAAAIATSRVFLACLLTSLTTAIGFASLLSSDIGMLRSFGVTAAFGVLIAFSVTITFLPAILAGISAPKRSAGVARNVSLEPVTRAVIKMRGAVLVVLVLVTAAAAYSIRYLEVDEGVRRQFDRDTDAGKTMTVLEDHLEGLRPIDVLLSSDRVGRFSEPEVASALDSITMWASAQDETLAARSIADVLREIRFATGGDREGLLSAADDTKSLARLGSAAQNAPDLATADYRSARIAVAMADIGSTRILHFVEMLSRRVADELEPFPDIRVDVGGEGYASSLGLESLIRDLARSLGIAILGIVLVLAFAFRSVRLAVIGMIPSGLPILFGLAYMTAREIPLGTATVIVFSVALGLAVDGTIHVIARYREELASHSVVDSVARALDGSGRAIIATCLTLVIGFGVLGFSSFIPVRQFGELIAVSIAGSLVSQLIFLPPLLATFGGKRRA